MNTKHKLNPFTAVFTSALKILKCSSTSFSQDATEIVKKADLKLRGNSSYAEMTIQIIRPDW